MIGILVLNSVRVGNSSDKKIMFQQMQKNLNK